MNDYLTLSEISFMHYMLIERFGGEHGLRDAGALEASLFRISCGRYRDIIQEAAALWESISLNHPFIDGNKRIAYAATFTFLRANGLKINANPISTYKHLADLYKSNKFEIAELELWLRNNISETPMYSKV